MARRLSALLLCGALLLSLLSGCATEKIPQESLADTVAPEEEPQEEPVSGAEIPVGAPAEEHPAGPAASRGIVWQADEGLHPYTCTSVANQIVLSLLYESLFVVDGSFETRPLLCESCAVSEDGKVWHFDLRQDVTFSDGSGLTSGDVVTSLQAAKSSSLYRLRFENVTSIERDGTYGVIIRLSTAYENLPMLLDIPIVKGATVSSAVPLGTGPYAMGSSALEQNHNWWQSGTPVVDAGRLELIHAEDALAVRNSFEFGGADLAYTDPGASTLAAFHSDNERWGCPTTVMLYLGFNQSSNYFYSATLRSGVTFAVDRESIVSDIYGGFGLAASLPCSPQSSLYDSALASSYTYNPGSFQACLQASGVQPNPGSPVKLIVSDVNPKRVQTAQTIARQLTDLGVMTEVTTYGEEDFQYALAVGNFDLYLAEIRLPTNFDLSCFFLYGSSACVGSNQSDSALQLCRAALENSGNAYDLYRTVMSRGLICPIMFKVNALYATRGVLQGCSPAVSTLLYGGSDQAVTDILSETPYEVPEYQPSEPEDIPLPGEEPGEPDEPEEGGDPEADGEDPAAGDLPEG